MVSTTVTAEPGSPTSGDMYVLPAGRTGTVWATFAVGSIAYYLSGTWYEYTPYEGLQVYSTATNTYWVYDGTWAVASGGGGSWGTITGTLSAQTDLQSALDLKAPLANPLFTSSITLDADVKLYRNAAGVGEQRNSTNAQGWLRYNTYTDASNYERQFGRWVSNVYEFGTEKLGTGVARGINIKINGASVLASDTSGNWSAWNSSRSAAVGTSEIAMNYYNNGVMMGSAGALTFGSSSASTPDLGLMRNAAGVGEINNGTAAAYRDLKLRNLITTAVQATAAAAPTIASAGTIAPTVEISFVSGTAAIDTITAPSPISAGGGTVTFVPTGLWTWTAAGNIAIAGSAVVNKAITFTYDVTTTKWYPSYYSSSTGTIGRHSIPIMAAAMSPSVTGGCAALATIASAAD